MPGPSPGGGREKGTPNTGTNMLIDTESHPIRAPLYPPVLRPHVFYSIALMLRFIVRWRLDAGLTAWHRDRHA
jgi:hypothetical protein